MVSNQIYLKKCKKLKISTIFVISDHKYSLEFLVSFNNVISDLFLWHFVSRVYSEMSQVRNNLTHPRFQLTEEEEEADIFWGYNHIKDYRSATKQHTQTFTHILWLSGTLNNLSFHIFYISILTYIFVSVQQKDTLMLLCEWMRLSWDLRGFSDRNVEWVYTVSDKMNQERRHLQGNTDTIKN